MGMQGRSGGNGEGTALTFATSHDARAIRLLKADHKVNGAAGIGKGTFIIIGIARGKATVTPVVGIVNEDALVPHAYKEVDTFRIG